MLAAMLAGLRKTSHAQGKYCCLAVAVFGIFAGRVLADCTLGCDVLYRYNWTDTTGQFRMHFQQSTMTAYQYYSQQAVSGSFVILKPSTRFDTDCDFICWYNGQYGEDSIVDFDCNSTGGTQVQIYTQCTEP